MSELSTIRQLIARRGQDFFLEREVSSRQDGYVKRVNQRLGPFRGAIIDAAMGTPMRGVTPSPAGDVQRTESWRLTCEILHVPQGSPDGTPGDVVTFNPGHEMDSTGERDIIDSAAMGQFRVLRAFPMGDPNNPVGHRCVLEKIESAG